MCVSNGLRVCDREHQETCEGGEMRIMHAPRLVTDHLAEWVRTKLAVSRRHANLCAGAHP